MPILRHVRVVDPARNLDQIADLGFEHGKITPPEQISDDREIDGTGLAALPGLIDLHVHLREPGYEERETIASGTKAAAAGGFTTVVAMPNTQPPLDTVERIQNFQRRVEKDACIRVLCCACLSKNRQGRELADLAALAREPLVVGFSDDGSCIQDSQIMREAAKQAAALALPISDHCENLALRGAGVIRQSPVADQLQVPGMPPETESAMVARNILLAEESGAHFHLQHLSCRQSIELLRDARRRNLPVSGEATPHHLALTWDALLSVGAQAKMNPPLGDSNDRTALQQALREKSITAIATDHAPHTANDKAKDLVHAPCGVIGLETALPICLTRLYHSGLLSLLELIACFTTGPAEILTIPPPSLAPGMPADLTLVDLDADENIDLSRSFSRSRNSPFQGYPVRGKVIRTLYRGRWVYETAHNRQPESVAP